VESFDHLYDAADDFESLYGEIVEELARLAHEQSLPVVDAVPGSPLVAERTVELLLAREDLEVALEPAVSVIDVACVALGLDPWPPSSPS
jgi:tetrapyrrole methylase family protein/MazG family protein